MEAALTGADVAAAAVVAAVSGIDASTSPASGVVDAAAAQAADAALEAATASSATSTPGTSTTTPTAITVIPGEGKKTGRPAHPLWAHFHRGEKRNRYHYHAFCVYCVARLGAEHVTPTRGVSIDMLRHLEKCANCPRRVVEHVKEVCGRRDAVRFDRYGKKKQQQQLQQQQLQDGASAADAGQQQQHGHSGAHAHASTYDSGLSIGSVRSADLMASPTTPLALKRIRTDTMGSLALPRGNVAAAVAGNMTPLFMDDKVALLKLAVAAGLPADCFYNADFAQLLLALRPSLGPPVTTSAVLASLLEPTFVRPSAARLAMQQLDRVKEGMLNSTIKGGLTLSLHCWTTRDSQHLVAFNLVNSSGDSACVAVVDMGALSTHGTAAVPYTSSQLAVQIEGVLLQLQQQRISVMCVVADSIVALNAARQVCFMMHRRGSLLVVPCFSRLLSVLAGAALTHPQFADGVGHAIEVASYFLNAKLLHALRKISGDAGACLVLPNRENWFSFVDCVTRLLKYQNAIVQLCQSEDSADVPLALKNLVLSNEQDLWPKLSELLAFLAPLQETYGVFFQQLRTVHADKSHPPMEVLEDDLAAAHGLTLAHVMYQLARMTQQYQAMPSALAQVMTMHIDTMWRRYELPAMVLAFVFNFHLDTTLLDLNQPCAAWPSIAQYFQLYYHRWFESATPPKPLANPEQLLQRPPLTPQRVSDILDAFKLNQFPFDADTTSDYIDVSSFYSFVSDSHAEICALCCRMYAVSLLTANVTRIVRGIGFVPSVAQTTRDPDSVELLLHVGFASSLRRNASSVGGNAVLGGMEAVLDSPAETVLWSEDDWHYFVEDWRSFVVQELTMDEFDAITQQCSEDGTTAILAIKVPVHQLFAETLPAMTVTLESPTTPTNPAVSTDLPAAAGVVAVAAGATEASSAADGLRVGN